MTGIELISKVMEKLSSQLVSAAIMLGLLAFNELLNATDKESYRPTHISLKKLKKFSK